MEHLFVLVIGLLTVVFSERLKPKLTHSELYTETPDDVKAYLGSRVVLPCKSRQKQDIVQWTRNGLGLGLKNGTKLPGFDRYRMRGEDGYNWDLEILEVHLEDDGIWDCQIPTISKSPPAYLTVLVPPEDPLIEGGTVKKVIENRKVTLTCVSKGGKPAPKIRWLNPSKAIVKDIQLESILMIPEEDKLYETYGFITIIPTKELHNTSFTCETWNEAGKANPTSVHLNVLFAPSVKVAQRSSHEPREGEKVQAASISVKFSSKNPCSAKVGFHCSAVANPPPYPGKYEWYLDNKRVPGQFGYFFEILNLTRHYHGRQLRCQVENELGVAKGGTTIHVTYPPIFLLEPSSVAEFEMDLATLRCAVDSNPSARYSWTKDDSKKIISHDQNLTLWVSSKTTGIYFCHASVSGFPMVTSRPAHLLLKAPPRIVSPSKQHGQLKDDAHINCVAISVPDPTNIFWKFHGKHLDENNPHYRIVNTPIQNGLRSTLIVRQAISSDFGTYSCIVTNSLGTAELLIELKVERPFPVLFTIIGSFTIIIIIMAISGFVILYYRQNRRAREDKKGITEATNNLIAANNVRTFKLDNVLKENAPMYSNGFDSDWNGSDDHQDDFFMRAHGNLTDSFLHDAQEFPPKPDVIRTGSIQYDTYEHKPPCPEETRDVIYDGGITREDQSFSSYYHSLLNVSNPRLSATYGNAYLNQISPNSIQYSTFLPPPSPSFSNKDCTHSTLASRESNSEVRHESKELIFSNIPSVHFASSKVSIAGSAKTSSITNLTSVQEEIQNRKCSSISPAVPTTNTGTLASKQSLPSPNLSLNSYDNGDYVQMRPLDEEKIGTNV